MLCEDTVFVDDDARGAAGAFQPELAVGPHRDPAEVGARVARSCCSCPHDVAGAEAEQNFLSRHVSAREAVLVIQGPAAAPAAGRLGDEHLARLQQNRPRSTDTRRQDWLREGEPVQVPGQFGKPAGKAADRDCPPGQAGAQPASDVFVMSGEKRGKSAVLAERTEFLRIVAQKVRDLLGRFFEVALPAGENKVAMVGGAASGQRHKMVEAEIIGTATVCARGVPLCGEVGLHLMMRSGADFQIAPLIRYLGHVVRAVLQHYAANRG